MVSPLIRELESFSEESIHAPPILLPEDHGIPPPSVVNAVEAFITRPQYRRSRGFSVLPMNSCQGDHYELPLHTLRGDQLAVTIKTQVEDKKPPKDVCRRVQSIGLLDECPPLSIVTPPRGISLDPSYPEISSKPYCACMYPQFVSAIDATLKGSKFPQLVSLKELTRDEIDDVKHLWYYVKVDPLTHGLIAVRRFFKLHRDSRCKYIPEGMSLKRYLDSESTMKGVQQITDELKSTIKLLQKARTCTAQLFRLGIKYKRLDITLDEYSKFREVIQWTFENAARRRSREYPKMRQSMEKFLIIACGIMEDASHIDSFGNR